jgi:cytochrome c oxidase subunit 2
MKKMFTRLMLAVAFVGWMNTYAADEPPAAYLPCAACHGDAGQGNEALGAPALASQDSAYLQRQLRHFKTGVRGSDERDIRGAQMKPMANTLSDDDIVLLAEYVSGLPARAPDSLAAGDLKQGNNYYQAKCGACHGGQAQGNPGLNAPMLAFLDAVYLKTQFRNFQQGIRGAHPDDTYGRQMKMMSTTLPTDEHLDDVIAYIHSLAVAQ